MTADIPDGLPTPRRYWAILVIILGVTMAVLDGSIANVALPTIAHDLHASAAQSVWVVNAYQLVTMVSLLALSSLGEIVGYARIYKIGIAIFGVASLACALSDSLTTLILARVLQGAGAACIMAVNTALVRFIYPKAWLGRGMGFNAFVVALASAVGPTIAAGILSVTTWQWIFAINVPLSAITFVLLGSLPEVKRAARKFDYMSAVLTALTFGLFITGIDGLGQGLDHLPRVCVQLAVAAVCGVLLVRRQLDEHAPLLPVDLMRIPIFALSVSTSALSFAGQMLAYIALPFYFQNVLGRDAVHTGLLMTPWPIAIMFVAPLAGRLSDRYPAGILGAIGLAVFAVGLTSMALLPAEPTNIQIVWRMVMCGAGFALFQSPNNRTMIGSAPMERTGGASGMLGTARLLGQTTGTALVALIFNLFALNGTHLALFTAAGFAVAAGIVSSLRLTSFGRTGRV